MSAKPGKEFHSAYIDGEMPSKFVSEYEDLLDSDLVPLSDEFVEKSFEKLQSRLAFAKNVREAENSRSKNVLKMAPAFAAAAAAAVTVVLLPAKNSQNAAEIKAIAHTDIVPLDSEDIKVDGTINGGLFASFSGSMPQKKLQGTVVSAKIRPISQTAVKIDGNIESNKLPEVFASKSSEKDSHKKVRVPKFVRKASFGSRLTSVDVFKPDFSESENIRISVPEFREMSEISSE